MRTQFTIALVEDHPDTLEMMCLFLQPEFLVSAHPTAGGLLSWVMSNHCDLILSDISLPEMNGYEMLAILRSTPALQHIPVIAVSAHATREAHWKALEAGFGDYLDKPVDLERLLNTIRKHLPPCTSPLMG